MGRGRRGRASPALPRSPVGSAQRVGGRRLGCALSPAPAIMGPETLHRVSRAGRTPLKSGRYLAQKLLACFSPVSASQKEKVLTGKWTLGDAVPLVVVTPPGVLFLPSPGSSLGEQTGGSVVPARCSLPFV